MRNKNENSCDELIETLIPWFVMNQLQGDDLKAVEDHISSCNSCAAQVESERKLAALVQENHEIENHEIPSDWDNFQDKILSSNLSQSDSIGAEESDGIIFPSSNVIRFPLINRFKEKLVQPKTLGFIAVAQAAALVAVISLPNTNTINRIGSTDEYVQTYDTLSSAGTLTSENANAIIQFDPAMSLDKFGKFLLSNDIILVSGPTSTDVYLVQIKEDDREAVLETLRSQEYVMLVESFSAE